MSFDLVTLRGLVEKIIDEQLAKENLANMHAMFEALKPAVKNRDDAIFGYIIGWSTASIYRMVTAILNRGLTQEEINEVAGTVTRRSLEIKHKIMETFT